MRVLHESGIDWGGRQARALAGLEGRRWDFVITVCDRAREACPVFPGLPVLCHGGMPDPAAVVGEGDVKLAAFYDALNLISRRIDLLLALPIEKPERLVLEAQMRAIGDAEIALGRTAADEDAS